MACAASVARCDGRSLHLPHHPRREDTALTVLDADLSVESFVRDLEAVADAAAPGPYVLFATGAMTAPAIVYAARHPERLSHLVLWMVFVHGRDHDVAPNRHILDMALVDWSMATESAIRELARTSAGVRFADRGEHELRGVGEAIRVFAVVPSDV